MSYTISISGEADDEAAEQAILDAAKTFAGAMDHSNLRQAAFVGKYLSDTNLADMDLSVSKLPVENLIHDDPKD